MICQVTKHSKGFFIYGLPKNLINRSFSVAVDGENILICEHIKNGMRARGLFIIRPYKTQKCDAGFVKISSTQSPPDGIYKFQFEDNPIIGLGTLVKENMSNIFVRKRVLKKLGFFRRFWLAYKEAIK